MHVKVSYSLKESDMMMIAFSPTYDVLDESCLARQAMHLIADKWTILVIYALSGGTQRYSQLHSKVGCITHKMLAQTLKRMERDGIITRTIYPVIPPKTEYALTELGQTLIEPLDALFKWGERNMLQVHEAREVFDAKTEEVDAS